MAAAALGMIIDTAAGSAIHGDLLVVAQSRRRLTMMATTITAATITPSPITMASPPAGLARVPACLTAVGVATGPEPLTSYLAG